MTIAFVITALVLILNELAKKNFFDDDHYDLYHRLSWDFSLRLYNENTA